jgi:hypothetical protein
MAQDLLGIPATSTPSERMFSRAGEIYTSHRRNMEGDAARALLNLGSWWGLEGLPGINTPIFHPDINLALKSNIHLPLVDEGEYGEFKISDDGGKEEDIDEALEADAANIEEDMEDIGSDDDELDVVEVEDTEVTTAYDEEEVDDRAAYGE